MKKYKQIYAKVFFSVLLSICLYACREKYTPEIKDINLSYLVVDGFINTGGDSTIFKISRTFKLDSKAISNPEIGAIVTVENSAGASFILSAIPSKPGTYAIPTINQDHTIKYRLRVRTKDNREYLSEFVESKISPPLELSYDFRNDNLNVYTNTNDASGNSKYYNYNYTETWEYISNFSSTWKIVNHDLYRRVYPQDDIHNCYHHVPSSNISIASTVSLNEDRLVNNPLVSIPSTSEKVRVEYSILVKQNVLTKAGFEFLETLKKNTEQVGSIFDAQPSQLYGNIHCTSNPNEVVIGFVSAGTVIEKRLTLIAEEMPFTYVGIAPDENCAKSLDTLFIITNDVYKYLQQPVVSEYLVIVELNGPGGIYAYVATKEKQCVDCRLQGGTTKVPAYWRR